MRLVPYRVHIGVIKCLIVSDGTFTYAPPTFPPHATFLFRNAPEERLQQALVAYDVSPDTQLPWISPYLCGVVTAGDHRVLIDTGAGQLGPDTGQLLPSLCAAGVRPEAIDTVILTHAHPDHLGGNTRDGEIAFPNARFMIGQPEWDFWTAEPSRNTDHHTHQLLRTIAQNKLIPITDRLTLLRQEEEIVPGLQVIPTPGHTPGHIAVEVSSNDAHLLCVSDAILLPIHVERPAWHAVVDTSPTQVMTTRQELFTRATTDNTLVLAFHFSFPGLGPIIEADQRWTWRSV